MSSTRAKELMALVNKQLGVDTVRMGSDALFKVDAIPTGVIPIDVLLGGGLPRNRFTVVYGDYSTLKSFIGLSAIAQVQKAGGVAALIDTEHAFNPEWATHLGVDVDALVLPPTEVAEQALDAGELLIRQEVDLLVVDSVAASHPQAEAGQPLYGKNTQPGRQAALMSQACRRLTSANSKTAVFWINQLRENIGMTFGPTEKQPGGRALPYYASLMFGVKKVGKVTEDRQMWDGDKFANSKVVVGQKYKAVLDKSKMSAPFSEVWFQWNLRDGGYIDNLDFLIAQGIEYGLIEKVKTTWHFDGYKAVGKDKFREMMRQHEAELLDALRPHLPGLPSVPRRKGARLRRRS